MNRGYIDRNLVQNSSLACFLLTDFIKKYEELTARTEGPALLKLLLVLPLVWHKDSCRAIQGRNFATPLRAVIAENPTIRTHLQERVAEFSQVSCQGLNLACAAGLVRQEPGPDAGRVRIAFASWPRGSRATGLPPDMTAANARLAVWFKDASTAELYSDLLRI